MLSRWEEIPRQRRGSRSVAKRLANRTWYAKGVALGKLGRPKDELDCYERALGLNANFPEAWLNKAISLGNARRFREARECFEKAQQLGYPDAAQGVAYCRRALAEE